jgi:hypothetical protein
MNPHTSTPLCWETHHRNFTLQTHLVRLKYIWLGLSTWVRIVDGKWEYVNWICRPTNINTFGAVNVISANNALIYCDLISPQFFGSQYVRVLRTFIMPTAYCNHSFENVYYMPVEKRRFHDIEIKIMRLDGTPVNFTESDVPVKIVLHFRRFSHYL